MTAIANLPDLRPSLLLDFLNTGRIDPRIEFTRASSATCFGPDGKLRTVAANVPRIDYDPFTGKCLGFLMEGSSTNLILRSNNFDHAAWTGRTNALLVAGALDPSGGNTAWTFRHTGESSSGSKAVIQTATVSANEVMYTGSIYIRRRTGSGKIYLRVGSLVGHQINVTSSWQRLSISAISPAAPDNCRFGIVMDVAGDEVDICWSQLEIGDFSTSYIPTDGAAVTRTAEVAQIKLGGWFNNSEGTLVSEYKLGGKLLNTRAVSIRGSLSGAGPIDVVSGSGSGLGGYMHVIDGGVAQATGLPVAISNKTGDACKIAFSYMKDNFAGSRDGGGTVFDTSGSVPAGLDSMYLGCAGASSYLNGYIRFIAFWPKAFPSSVQRLSA